jgi:tetratricopeptide (TPR) repeat protein
LNNTGTSSNPSNGHRVDPASGPSPALGDLHREIIEARNQAIKTDNLVKNLSAEIKQISRRQESYQRRYLLNSAVAYVLFVAAVFTGLYLAFDARVSSARREVSHYQVRNFTLQQRVDELERDVQQRREAENRAYAFWELLERGNADEVVEQFAELQSQVSNRAMIELLRARVAEVNYDLAGQAFRAGLGHMQADRWSEARDAFMRSLTRAERTPWQAEIYYNLAETLYQLQDFEGGLHYFDEALATGRLDDAHNAMGLYRRALCLEATGRLVEASEVYRRYRADYPTHRHAGRALSRINAIAREIERQPVDE